MFSRCNADNRYVDKKYLDMFATVHSPFTGFMRKNLPRKLGGLEFYDRLLDDVTYESPHRAWKVFHEQFINDVINSYSQKQKWNSLPYLNPVDCPCAPGSVIMMTERPIKDMLLRRPYSACVAGTLGDFCPQERAESSDAVAKESVFPVGDMISQKPFKKVYQAKNRERAVVITMYLQEKRSLVDFDTDNVFIDLDNFDSTGYIPGRCYVITSVLYAARLTVEVTFDGTVFYEHTYGASTPVCFRAAKTRLVEEGRGIIESLKDKDKVLPIKLARRRGFQNFFNAFIPNQSKLSHCVGDCPTVMDWEEPPPVRTFRPRFLPRPDRPSVDIFALIPDDLDLINQVNVMRGSFDRVEPSKERTSA